MEEKISAVIICDNDGEIIKRALDSLKGAVDEIIVLHDGKCTNNTLDIARKYTKQVLEMKRKARAPKWTKAASRPVASWRLLPASSGLPKPGYSAAIAPPWTDGSKAGATARTCAATVFLCRRLNRNCSLITRCPIHPWVTPSE